MSEMIKSILYANEIELREAIRDTLYDALSIMVAVGLVVMLGYAIAMAVTGDDPCRPIRDQAKDACPR